MSLDTAQKKEIVEKFKQHPSDTGSAAVQIALLSERINLLSDHFKAHKKDFNSRRGLLALVGRRRRLLNYLKQQSPTKYHEVIKELNLRK